MFLGKNTKGWSYFIALTSLFSLGTWILKSWMLWQLGNPSFQPHMVAKVLPLICCLVRTLPRFLTAHLAPWISWFPEGICKVDDTAFLVSVIMASQILAASLSNACKLLLIISYLISSLFSVGTSGWCQLLSHSWKEKPALLRTSHFFASFIFPVLSPTILSS